MAEDNNKILPDAENHSADTPAKDEVIGEITDALEKKLHENEDENVPVKEPPKQSDDDILTELKEALDKAENNDDADDILTGGKTLKQSDKTVQLTEEDSDLPIEPDAVDTDAEQGKEEDAPDKKDVDGIASDTPKSNWQSRSADTDKSRRTTPVQSDNSADRAKKRNPGKIILLIVLFLIVGAGVFALVHYVIAPSISPSGNNTGANGSSSQSGGATGDQLETAPVAPTESGYALMASNAMKDMSRREKICQLFIVTPEKLTNEEVVTQAGNLTKEGLKSYPVGGVIYTQQNLTGEDQAKSLVSDTQSFSKIPLFITVDDDAVISTMQNGQSAGPGTAPGNGPEGGPGNGPEGGPGNGPEGGPGNGPEGGPGNGPEQDPSEAEDDITTEGAYEDAVETSEQKHDVGFNLDFSLDADLSDAKENDPDLKDADVNSLLSSAIKGYNEGGVIPTLKYFPVMKAEKDDSSESEGSNNTSESGFIHINHTAEELDNSSEFSAFRSGIESGAGMIMVNHVFVDKIDTEKPATLSSKVVPELLRKKLNYQGVAITGNMSADYFTTEYKYSTIVKGIFNSDIDMILNPNSIQSYVEEIESMMDSGTITEEQLDTKVKRILTLKYQSGVIGESNGSTESSEAAE